MNEMFRPPQLVYRRPGTTQAGDGLPRRKWSADEIQRMLEAGIVEHGERFELIGGDLVAMAAKGNQHEELKFLLCDFWVRSRAPEISVAQEVPLRLSENDVPEPDFISFPSSIRLRNVRGDTVLLVVEVADSSLKHDKMIKGRQYASFGVREYWVIDAVKLVTTVHLDPRGTSYASVKDYKARKLLTPHLAPSLAVRLSDLKLD